MSSIKLMSYIFNTENKFKVLYPVSRASSSGGWEREGSKPNASRPYILRNTVTLLAVASLALLTQFASAQAEHVTNADPYTLRANTIRSQFIPNNVASEYNLDAGPNRGVLNVVVQRKMPNGRNLTVPAEVIAYQRNLMGQSDIIELQTVTANDRITYVGTFDFGSWKNLHFVVEATPQDSEETITLEFEEKF